MLEREDRQPLRQSAVIVMRSAGLMMKADNTDLKNPKT
jgi:hypothetical protein